MAERRTITIALMDPPYETARSTTAFRIIDIAVRRGYNVNVFAYEGAVALPFALQKPHANAMHGRTAEEENHPLTRDWTLALMREAARRGATLTWINCGLCVDERGAENAVEGVKRGSPADFLRMVQESDNTLVIPTR
jgi:tRNA 2-thiouridine synthesizing protein D